MEARCLDRHFSTTRRLFKEPPKLKEAKGFKRLVTYPISGQDIQGGLRVGGLFKHSTPDMPLVSVIIATLNSQEFLEETLQSIFDQSYENLECLVIDGGSTDGTLEILNSHKDQIDYFLSQKDKGISEAFNKGVRLAFGDYINFQGDGDGFFQSDALKEVMEGVCTEMLISARIVRTDKKGEVLYTSAFLKNFDKRFLRTKMVAHQGLLTHRDYFNTYGLFDEDLIFSMDYEHLLRSYHAFPSFLAKEQVMARWREGGLGTNRELEIFKEWGQIKRRHKIASPMVLKTIEKWILVKFYLKRALKWWGKH